MVLGCQPMARRNVASRSHTSGPVQGCDRCGRGHGIRRVQRIMSTIVEEVDGQPSIVHAPLNGYRIAAESYGALNPIERDHFFPDDVGSWNRFDTTGRTLYAASTRNGAFSECLYSYRLDSSARTAIGFMAERFGLTEDEAYNLYADEQESLGHDRPGGFPANWREGRRPYHLSSTQDLTWFNLSTTHFSTLTSTSARKFTGLVALRQWISYTFLGPTAN